MAAHTSEKEHADTSEAAHVDRPLSDGDHTLGMRIVAGTRFVTIVPVLGLMVGSITLVIAAAFKTVSTVMNALQRTYDSKDLLVAFIEIADIYLLGIVLYIIALGVFELFVDDRLPLPSWLEFHHLNDLEHKLIGVVTVVLTVYFLGLVIKTPPSEALQVLYMGAGIGIVVAAVGFFMWASAKSSKH